MASVNRVTLVGNLGADPEVINTATGQVLAKVSLATTDRYKDKATGETKEQTEWHRLVFWNDLAETAGKWLKKGTPIYVEGRIKYGQYTGNDGITRYTTDIVVSTMQMLGQKGNTPDSGNNTERTTNTDRTPTNNVAEYLSSSVTPDIDDDIPF